ncbi:Sensor histidine kinase BtsS [BD1-7 clade bacterium]|uniref:Sensor histidine kinase BtsS n=1 Tax=BD1-7 clade bacterium TaxID=2029982 RepID=A0A5S9PG87_9GAMM|nr:Sensor histidine kinase BtsS [BD1-7 clade bacterium]CAA0102927.1 Sensor histidine kinase BtsS [BD1-7 clade bacterium]
MILERLLILVLAYTGIAAVLSVRGSAKGFFSVEKLARDPIAIIISGTLLAIAGNLLAVPYGEGIVNLRPVGVIIAGLLGGPIPALIVATVGGVHRLMSVGGDLALPALAATLVDAALAGAIGHRMIRQRSRAKLISPLHTLSIAAAIMLAHELTIFAASVATGMPVAAVMKYLWVVAPPMVIANTFGVGFMLCTLNLQAIATSRYLDDVLDISRQVMQKLDNSMEPEQMRDLLALIRERLQLQVVGLELFETIDMNEVVTDGHTPKNTAATGSIRIIQGQKTCGHLWFVDDQGDSRLTRDRVASIASLLSHRMTLLAQEQQQKLLLASELKSLRAQVNPHFLFNALNTLHAVTRQSPDDARALILQLADFFRNNLTSDRETHSLADELMQVRAYLAIERKRFGERLRVTFQIDPELQSVQVPVFSLQLLAENAIKHGIGCLPEGGTINISSRRDRNDCLISVCDSAGLLHQSPEKHNKSPDTGLGMALINQRTKGLFGRNYGLQMEVTPNEETLAILRVPITDHTPCAMHKEPLCQTCEDDKIPI